MNKKTISTFIHAILAGASVGIAATAYLSVENKIAGALFFTLGLFMVCTFDLYLFTGKIGYIFENKPSYLLWIVNVWCGNLVGTYLTGMAIRSTRLFDAIGERASHYADVKLSDNLVSVFILAIFCNIMMVVVVDGYKNNQHEVGKYVGMLLGVGVFIVCGFEHCIANMFYITLSGQWSMKAFIFVLVCTVGNAVGSVIIPLARQYRNKSLTC